MVYAKLLFFSKPQVGFKYFFCIASFTLYLHKEQNKTHIFAHRYIDKHLPKFKLTTAIASKIPNRITRRAIFTSVSCY